VRPAALHHLDGQLDACLKAIHVMRPSHISAQLSPSSVVRIWCALRVYGKGGVRIPRKHGLSIIPNEKESQIRLPLRMPRVPELQSTSLSLGRADGTRLSALGIKWGKRWRNDCGVVTVKEQPNKVT